MDTVKLWMWKIRWLHLVGRQGGRGFCRPTHVPRTRQAASTFLPASTHLLRYSASAPRFGFSIHRLTFTIAFAQSLSGSTLRLCCEHHAAMRRRRAAAPHQNNNPERRDEPLRAFKELRRTFARRSWSQSAQVFSVIVNQGVIVVAILQSVLSAQPTPLMEAGFVSTRTDYLRASILTACGQRLHRHFETRLFSVMAISMLSFHQSSEVNTKSWRSYMIRMTSSLSPNSLCDVAKEQTGTTCLPWSLSFALGQERATTLLDADGRRCSL